jgi:Spy/CpxP family protein refolding chaperone
MLKAGLMLGLTAVAAQAQGMQHDGMDHGAHMGAMGMGGGPAGGPGGFGGGPIGRLIAAKQQLGLTDDQVKKLEALRTTQQAQLAPNASQMLRLRADLLDAEKGDGDLAAARKALEKINAARTDRAVAMLKARQDVRAILTADQKAKVDAWMAEHRGGHGRMGPGHGGRAMQWGQGGMRGGRGMMMGPGGQGMGPGMGPMGGMRPRRDSTAPKPPEGQDDSAQPQP